MAARGKNISKSELGGGENRLEKLWERSSPVVTLERGGDSLEKGEHRRRGDSGERGGGVIGVLVGDVSGEASVEKGDCLRRMERSSEGPEKGRGLRERPFPRWESGGVLGEDRREDVIRSITSMSKEGSSSRTGLTSSSSISDWSSCPAPSLTSSTPSSPVLAGTPSSSSSSSFSLLSKGSVCDWSLSLVGSVAVTTSSNWLCD